MICCVSILTHSMILEVEDIEAGQVHDSNGVVSAYNRMGYHFSSASDVETPALRAELNSGERGHRPAAEYAPGAPPRWRTTRLD